MSRAPATPAPSIPWGDNEIIAHILSNIERVDRGELPTPCWEWQGSRTKDGYGQFSVDAAFKGSGQRLAHRASYGAHNGFRFTSRSQQVMHQCHNRACCNAAHLKLGTAKENAAEAMARGSYGNTRLEGYRNGNAKLTEADVRSIRDLLATGESLRGIAARFGVDKSTVSNIAKKQTWRHVK